MCYPTIYHHCDDSIILNCCKNLVSSSQHALFDSRVAKLVELGSFHQHFFDRAG